MRTVNGQAGDLRESSTGELVRQLSEQSSQLIRQELDLAKAELTEKGKRAGIGAGVLAAAAVAAMFALGALTAAVILALDEGTNAWVAALIVTAVYAIAAAILIPIGRDRLKESMPPAPEETVESVKEDVQWTKTRARQARR